MASKTLTQELFEIELEKQLRPVLQRLGKLEAAVFPPPRKGGPGGPSGPPSPVDPSNLVQRIQDLGDRIDAVGVELDQRLRGVDVRIKEVIEEMRALLRENNELLLAALVSRHEEQNLELGEV